MSLIQRNHAATWGTCCYTCPIWSEQSAPRPVCTVKDRSFRLYSCIQCDTGMQCLPAESDLLRLIVWSLVGVDEPDQAGLRPVLLCVPLWVLVQKLLQITTQLQAGGCCVWPVRVPGRQVAGLSFRWLCRCRQQGTAFDPVLSTNRDAEDKRGLAKLLRSGGSRDLSDPQLQAATQKVLAEPGRQKSQQLPFLHLLAPHVHAAGQRALPNVCARKAGQALQLASICGPTCACSRLVFDCCVCAQEEQSTPGRRSQSVQ